MELTPNELVVRKTALFFKTVDPKKVTDAIAGKNKNILWGMFFKLFDVKNILST